MAWTSRFHFDYSLIQPENMEDMVKMITKEPEDEVEEKLRFK